MHRVVATVAGRIPHHLALVVAHGPTVAEQRALPHRTQQHRLDQTGLGEAAQRAALGLGSAPRASAAIGVHDW